MDQLTGKEPPVAAQWLAMANHTATALPLGERLKQLRHERSWSQADLAAKVSADPGQISRYENGHMTPSAEAVVKLAEVLDVSCDYLLVETSPRRPLHAPENVLGHHLSAVAELGEADLASLLNVLDALVAKTRMKAVTAGIN
jgi:transcriptional regulator with XRE-family HTH domain